MLRRKYLLRIVLIPGLGVYLLAMMTSCVPKLPKFIRPASKVVVRVDVSPQANNNNPIAVDLVLVQSSKLYKELMKLSASEWFEKRKQYKLDYPKEIGLSAGSWEWVPGQVVDIDPMSFKYDVAGGLIFANYLKPGTHRAVINPSKPVVITLGPDDISVKPEK